MNPPPSQIRPLHLHFPRCTRAQQRGEGISYGEFFATYTHTHTRIHTGYSTGNTSGTQSNSKIPYREVGMPVERSVSLSFPRRQRVHRHHQLCQIVVIVWLVDVSTVNSRRIARVKFTQSIAGVLSPRHSSLVAIKFPRRQPLLLIFSAISPRRLVCQVVALWRTVAHCAVFSRSGNCEMLSARGCLEYIHVSIDAKYINE